MSTWPTVALGDVLHRCKEVATVDDALEYREVTLKLWGRGVVLRHIVAGSELQGQRRFLAQSGQFILSRIDARNGAIGLVPEDLDGALLSNDFPVFDIEKSRLKPGFLGWLTKTPGFVDLCRKASEGTTNRVRLKEDRFLALEIPLPPIEEQRRIVAKIEDLAAKVEEARGLRLQTAEGVKAFVTSVHMQLAGTRMRKIRDILDLDEDSVRILSHAEYPQVGVKSFGGGLFAKPAIAGTETSYKAFNRLYEGALVLSQVKGWEGAVAICPHNLGGWYVSPEYRTFRCIENESHPGYLSSLVRTEWFWGKFKQATKGVGARRERTRPEQFLEIELPMPNSEQQKIGEKLFAEMDSINHLHTETSKELDALLPSILDKAFKGEL